MDENRVDEMLMSKIPPDVWERYDKWIDYGHEDGMEPPKDLIDDFREALGGNVDDIKRILEILNDVMAARIARGQQEGNGKLDELD